MCKPRIVVTMPAYRAECTLAKTLHAIPTGFADSIIVVDDASPDQTVQVAQTLGLRVVAHEFNRGYGGNQKTCYDLALADGADIVVLLHPDYQYEPKVLPDLVRPLLEGQADFTFGSRFSTLAAPLDGGMPLYRYLGNLLTSKIENAVLGTHFSELHSGFKAYTRRFLTEINYHQYDEKFVFDSQMLIEAILLGYSIKEVAVPTRYSPESSSISFKNSLVYVARTFETLLVSKIQSSQLRKAHLQRLFERHGLSAENLKLQ